MTTMAGVAWVLEQNYRMHKVVMVWEIQKQHLYSNRAVHGIKSNIFHHLDSLCVFIKKASLSIKVLSSAIALA